MFEGGKFGETWRDMQERELLVLADNSGVWCMLDLRDQLRKGAIT